jgi:hypothetical protein
MAVMVEQDGARAAADAEGSASEDGALVDRTAQNAAGRRTGKTDRDEHELIAQER